MCCLSFTLPHPVPPVLLASPQMPPEELEKMHHIEKHIRKNQLKVGA
jgi:hypothetical protein